MQDAISDKVKRLPHIKKPTKKDAPSLLYEDWGRLYVLT